MLQGLLLVKSNCSIEISKGNLDFLALALGNTQTCSLVFSHHSCLAVATWGSSPATQSLGSLHASQRDPSAPLLPASLPACWRGHLQPELLRGCLLWCFSQSAVGEEPGRAGEHPGTSSPASSRGPLSFGCRDRASRAALVCWPSCQAKELPVFIRLLPACSIPVESRYCPPLAGRAQGSFQGETGGAPFRRPANEGLKCSFATSSVLGTNQ